MASKVRIGLIGASVKGTWSSRSHLPALQASDDFELTAVCTTKADSAESAREAYGARLAFHDFREMAASSEIDAVAIVVRVPSHYEPAKAAIEAGKHVYCEWPLGQTTEEAVDLTKLAADKGVMTAIGLQARACPAIQHMKQLVADGYVGEVLSVHCHVVREGVLSRPSHRTWQRDVELGANSLTIINGHTFDALRYVGGEVETLSAMIDTRVDEWLDTGSNEMVEVSSPDHILIQGRLENGTVMSSHTSVIPYAGSGYRMAVYGRDGTLAIEGPDSVQLTPLRLYGAQGGGELAEIAIPKDLTIASPGTPEGQAFNVAQMYAGFARSIREGKEISPSFSTAVDLHRLIDVMRKSSAEGCALPAR